MYQLLVCYPGDTVESPSGRFDADGDVVLDLIPSLLEAHAGCEGIAVVFRGALLFSVASDGDWSPGRLP